MQHVSSRIGILSTFPPRECGIGTYSSTLVDALHQTEPSTTIGVVAMSDEKYTYTPTVITTINQDEKNDYAAAAAFLNDSNLDVASLQHEYGIYGGEHGDYVLDFLRALTKPVVTTLHSVLVNHSTERHNLTQAILDRSATVVVMLNQAKKMLVEGFSIDPNKIVVIHHGVPEIITVDRAKVRQKLAMNDQFVLTTIGLLNPGKGIEHVLEALPTIIDRVPNVHYYVVGKTHPKIRKAFGEQYRELLIKTVEELQLKDHVTFIDKFLTQVDLVDLLLATDAYMAIQGDPQQATSGTVAYAIGAGTPVVATPTVYAKEMLADGRGFLVPFGDAARVAIAVVSLATSTELQRDVRRRSYELGQQMTWSNIGKQYLQVFRRAAAGGE